MWTAPREDHGRLFMALMAALVSLAWFALWFSGHPHRHGLLRGLHGLDAFGGGVVPMLAFVAGWTVMVVAMMLPTSLPLISLFRTLTRRRKDRKPLAALLVAGYLGTWTLFGAVVYAGGWVLHRTVEGSAWLEANAWALGAGILVLAGAYQFTPLKHHCLEKCRSPLSFIMEHWRGEREASHALRLGVHHGLFCIGCCWSLMLLMFLVGATGALAWMLALGAVMAVEKNASWGRRIGAPLGMVLMGLGVIVATASALQPNGESLLKIPLAPTDRSGVNGVATFSDAPGGIEIDLDVRGLPDPGATYLAHVHPGSCASGKAGTAGDRAHHRHGSLADHAHGQHDEAKESAGEIGHPLTPVTSNLEGRGTSATLVEAARIDDLPFGQEFYVNVHAEASGSEELPAGLACGDFRRSGQQES